MIKKELKSHSIVTFAYFVIISLFNLNLRFDLLFLWLGALLGTFLLDIDHVLIGLNPENKNEWAEEFRSLCHQKKYKKAALHLGATHLDHRHLIFHSVVFQPILLILGFFTLTSTGSLFGSGMIMSINLHLLKDEWQCFLEEGNFSWVFWQIKRKIDLREQRLYLITVSGLFILLTLFLL